MTYELFVTVLICVAVSIFVTMFFRHYGVFRFPPASVLILLINACIPFIMVIGLLPYDVSLSLFGSLPTYRHSLLVAFQVFYWVSNIMSFVIAPVTVYALSYSRTISRKHRIFMAIYDNIIFYVIVLAMVIIGLIILMANGTLTLSSIPSLIVALTNMYGLLIFCFLMGYGLVKYPENLWKMSEPKPRYFYYLKRIAHENHVLKRAVSNGRRVLELCFKTREFTVGEVHELYNVQGIPREAELTRLTYELPNNFEEDFHHKDVDRMQQINWEVATIQNMEDFFILMDQVSESITQANKYIVYSGEQASKALHEMCDLRDGSFRAKSKIILLKISAVLTAIMSVIVLWGELVRMFLPDISVFHQLSHLKISPAISILFITTPILMFQTYIGSWSLTHVRIGSFFRFIEGATNVRTLYYWTSVISKLLPTIGYHYLTQIEATQSQFVEVMGVMDKIPFLGRELVTYSPIVLFFIIACVVLNVWDKILIFVGLKKLTFNDKEFNEADMLKGEDLLRNIDPDVDRILMEDTNLCVKPFSQETILDPLTFKI
ncbi:hypothetical protein TRFO_06753 [Tritrichomonas foetus]|uniref:LMBR1-like conserved region family protein n=1 Tax=Tritrichomonas foetus TaxID=1144522 RepID=A0A1J4JXC3_9EUKA|nr:hypothetical protein TRFO_06753 [Tritrichomonas foetus]|eukprot:OHT03112.1 hypothetical protein TRFO_06753 [Tritrichomonas foetus]